MSARGAAASEKSEAVNQSLAGPFVATGGPPVDGPATGGPPVATICAAERFLLTLSAVACPGPSNRGPRTVLLSAARTFARSVPGAAILEDGGELWVRRFPQKGLWTAAGTPSRLAVSSPPCPRKALGMAPWQLLVSVASGGRWLARVPCPRLCVGMGGTISLPQQPLLCGCQAHGFAWAWGHNPPSGTAPSHRVPCPRLCVGMEARDLVSNSPFGPPA